MSFGPSRYNYTPGRGWFFDSELKCKIATFIDGTKSIDILEIGSFEGLSSCYLIDELLHHPDSTIECVDPFDVGGAAAPLTKTTKQIFLDNIQKSNYPNKCKFYEMYSSEFFKNNTKCFDFIYRSAYCLD